MAQPNVTVVVGQQPNKRGRIKNKLTTNPFWSQINNNSAIVPPQFQPPVRSLTEVPTNPPQQPKPVLLPPKPALVDLVNANSPHVPSINLNTGKKYPSPNITLIRNPAAMIAANKKQANVLAGNKKPATANTGNNKPATVIAANVTKNIVTNMAQKNATNMAKMNVAKNIAKNIAARIAAGNDDANTSNDVDNNQPNPNQPKVLNHQKRNWQKFKAKIQKKKRKQQKNVNKKNAMAAGNQPGTIDDPQNEESQESVPENYEATPTTGTNEQRQPVAKLYNMMKSKKYLQREMARQRLTFQKQNRNAPGNEHETTTDSPQNDEADQSRPNEVPKGIEAPKPSPTGGPIPGFSKTQPIFEQIVTPQVTPTTTRSNAGSFFKPIEQQTQPKSQPQQQQQQQLQQQQQQTQQQQQQQQQQRQQPLPSSRKRGPIDIYAHKYPKGIPKSFLIQQKKSQEPGNEQKIAPDAPIWPSGNFMAYQNQNQASTPLVTPKPATSVENTNPAPSPIFVETENQSDIPQPYSPSDIYTEYGNNPEPCDDSQSSEQGQSGQKRLSAFQRLGPLSQPKKPKLTINLTLNKEQPVREVVNGPDDDPDRYTPVHLRQDIIMSTDETVMKYLHSWPWRKNVGIRRSATARNSRSVMILEQEQMEEAYDKDNFFIQITVKGYPGTWTKERVLDAVLDSVKGYSLIPCFTEFYQHECKFLCLRSRSALIVLHKTGFYIHKDGVELTITISQTDLSLNQIDFIPRIILRKRVAMGYADKKLNLSAFTLQDDVSHFIYFPLNRVSNQTEFIQLQSVIAWDHLTELDLSHNRLTNISGFDLHTVTPRLKHLNLSFNRLEKITVLLSFRELPLKTIHLEGNPLCQDYIEAEHYVKVVRMMFPAVVEIDGVPIPRKGELPQFKQNFCPEGAKDVTEKFLDIFFPLLDSGSEHRSLIQGMYEENATLTVTYAYKLRYSPTYRCFRNLFLYARFLDEGETDSVMGAMAITKLINRWPHTEHDPFTFTVDVLFHTESTTILRIGGILKLTAETLAEDEHLLSFTRTVVLYNEHGDEYKIQNEMIYWDEPTAACARAAFRVNTISQKKLNLKIESTTDEDLRQKFLKIFMTLTTMDKKISERCLEINNWNFKLALEHFTKLLKLNNLDSLTKEVNAN